MSTKVHANVGDWVGFAAYCINNPTISACTDPRNFGVVVSLFGELQLYFTVDFHNCISEGTTCTINPDGQAVGGNYYVFGLVDELSPNTCPSTGVTFPFDPSGTTVQIASDCSVKFPGCTDPAATNYDPGATVDDGSCMFPPTCKVKPLTPITDALALKFENAANAGTVPQESLFFPNVDVLLDAKIGLLESFAALLPANMSRASGYRPPAYQSHLYEIKTRLSEWNTATKQGTDANQVAECQALKNSLDDEVARHHLQYGSDGLLKVNPWWKSDHSAFPARAIDLGGFNALLPAKQDSIDLDRQSLGLVRPCATDPAYHLTLASQCKIDLLLEVFSAIDILVTTPDGKRVGFDPSSGNEINEVGEGTYYSGRGSEPQWIEIGGATPGPFMLTGFANGSGPYRIRIVQNGDDGDVIDSFESAGEVIQGQVVSLDTLVPGDSIPPTTVATPSPLPNATGWNNTNVTVSFTATDNPGGSGVKQIKFATSGAQTTFGVVHGDSASIAITAEGTTTIHFSASDNAGNTESPKTLTVKIDKTLPTEP